MPAPTLPERRPEGTGLRAKEQTENFPVALRVLPAAVRRHLRAIYDVARVLDDLGDEAPGDRSALLTAFGRDLALVWTTGRPQEPVLRRLVPTVRALGLEQQPFDRLLAANLQDQQVSSYATLEDLLAYCRLSADPVGRLVLAVFGVADERAVVLSDRVCSALQLLEHWQDVAEDRRAGRVYLPEEDLQGFAVVPTDLDAAASTPALRRLVLAETERAAALLAEGTPLVGLLRGWARLAVAGYVAGGRATVSALRRSGGEVLAGPPRPRRRDVAREVVRLLREAA